MFEGDGDFEAFGEGGDEFVFEVFWVLECEGVVVVHVEGEVWISAPHAQHCGVDYVGKGALRIIRNRFSKSFVLGSTAPKVSLAACKANEKAVTTDTIGDPSLPLEVGGVGEEVLWLEGCDDGNGELGLCGQGLRFATIVTSMTKFLAHKSIAIVAVVWLFRNVFIVTEVAGPPKFRPTDSSSRCMWVSRLASVKVSSVLKEVPLDCSDDIALSRFCVTLC